jgi:hypothetical protein
MYILELLPRQRWKLAGEAKGKEHATFGRLALKHQARCTFRTAAFNGGEATLWVSSDQFAMSGEFPLLPQERPNRCITEPSQRTRSPIPHFRNDSRPFAPMLATSPFPAHPNPG